ncbi:hypothetical protein GCM10028826_15190 [Mucilaginibacter boryungensis]
MLVYNVAQSQNTSRSFVIKLKNLEGETFIAEQQGLTQKHLSLSNGKYSGIINGPGYYTLANHSEVLNIYAEPGTNLTITKNTKNGVVSYNFAGNGSAENKFLARLNKAQQRYLPVNGDILTDKVNMIVPADFIKRLDQYKAISMQMLSGHDFSPGFIDLEKAYIDCKAHSYALQYFEDYGVNAEKKKIYLAKLTSGDPSLNTPEGKQAALDSVYTKELTFNDRKLIARRIYQGFDLNNEVLFKCSPLYSNFVIEEVSYLASTGGNTKISYARRRIDFIVQLIANPYIKQTLLNKYMRDL